jgi:hypothetical protein
VGLFRPLDVTLAGHEPPEKLLSSDREGEMMTREELIEYFNEHILYELLMVRYAQKQLKTETQIIWNAMFATFNVSARNLYEFLNNKGSNNEVKVCDYQKFYGKFGRTPISDITGTLQKLNERCFHMGKKGPTAPDKKVNSQKIQTMLDWIEENMNRLVTNFDEEFRAEIQLQRANPNNQLGTMTRWPTNSTTTTSHPMSFTVRSEK